MRAAALDVRRIEDRRDHRDRVGAGRDQRATRSAAVIPPIATTGTFHRALAARQQRGVARTASGLTVETKKLPKAM